MKIAPTLVLASLGLIAMNCHLLAQSYSIDWHSIAGGGGTSTGGVYSVSGTIGQSDAGNMSGGTFSLTGGFWSLFAVQTTGAPRLTISFTSTNTALVSWPSPSPGWNPQQNSDLNSTNWIVPAESIGDDGTNKVMVIQPPTGNRFYRLYRP